MKHIIIWLIIILGIVVLMNVYQNQKQARYDQRVLEKVK